MNPQIVQGAARFHEAADLATSSAAASGVLPIGNTFYTFENFFHPLIGKLIKQLNQATGRPDRGHARACFLAKQQRTPFFATGTRYPTPLS